MMMTSPQTSTKLYRIFSGIQPTGIPHLGNYFGALSRWINVSEERKVCVQNKQLPCDIPIFSIVDIHAYAASNRALGQEFYNNILLTTASLLALGLDPNKCILFRQSDLFEHNYLDNVFHNFVTTRRLAHMTQYKDKSRDLKSVTNGLLNYPVLQAADILLYRADKVPVGEDQVQHVELTRDIARKFNTLTNYELFPDPEALLEESPHSRRIKSLRDPDKKMSKSDLNKKSFIEVVDHPDVILEKCKKALTDCNSEVSYDLKQRPGVSNLMRIYHLATGDSIESITSQFKGQDTGQFKIRLADVLIDKFKNAREEFKRIKNDRGYLEKVLKMGAEKARPIANETVTKVKYLLGSYRET